MLGRLVDGRQRERGRIPESVWGTVFDRIRELDGLTINPECALSTRGRQWTETDRPFHFRADPGRAVPALDPDLRNDRSILFVADLDVRGVAELRLEPIEIYDFGVHEADAATWLRRTMRQRSRPFGTTFERDGDALACHAR